jgi:NitT/TauT family transport system substrate-binding protein
MLTLLLLACTGGPASGPTPEGAPALRRVRLALNWFPEPEFGGFYEAELGGYYEKSGFDVEILPGGPGAPGLELLQSGQAEAAITAADDLLLKRARGIAAVGAWPAFQLSPVGLMVHPGRGIQRFQDIQGGRIALEVGGPFEGFLWKTFGWEDRVERVPTTGSVSAFLADPALIQQAYVTSEPCVARDKGVEVVFLRAADAGWNPYGSLLAVADPAPDWTAAFVAATRAGWEAYLADPSRANAEIARLNPQMEPGLLGCVTEAQRPFVVGTDGLGAMTEARWNATNEALVGLGLLPAGSTAAGAWIAAP